jgi:hypothetical protein
MRLRMVGEIAGKRRQNKPRKKGYQGDCQGFPPE